MISDAIGKNNLFDIFANIKKFAEMNFQNAKFSVRLVNTM